MGTRGAWGFVIDGRTKIMYNQFDSYPEGLGIDIARWLTDALHDETKLREQVTALAPVPDREPTEQDFEQLARFHDPDVSTGRDWYSLLRKAQGDPASVLESGRYEPADTFTLDSLYCEWAYIVDLDSEVFEVYKGFQTTPPQRGRWAGSAGVTHGYCAVELVGSFPFDQVRSGVSFASDESLTFTDAAHDDQNVEE